MASGGPEVTGSLSVRVDVIKQGDNFLVAWVEDNTQFASAYDVASSSWNDVISSTTNSTYNIGSTYTPTEMALDPTTGDVLITNVSFESPTGSYRPFVVRWDGVSLTSLGDPVGDLNLSLGFAQDWMFKSDIDVFSTGVPVIAFGFRSDGDPAQRPYVMTYVDGSWTDQSASAGFTATRAEGIQLRVNSADRLYLYYSDADGTDESQLWTASSGFGEWTPLLTQTGVDDDRIAFSPTSDGTMLHAAEDSAYVLDGTTTTDISQGYVSVNEITTAEDSNGNFLVANQGGGVQTYSTPDPLPFITTWETTSADETIQIPTRGFDVFDNHPQYNTTIDWGDGTTETITGDDPDPTHTYATAGTYTVEITGIFPAIDLYDDTNGEVNAQKLQTIEQWGDIEWYGMGGAFMYASNVTYNATDAPDLSNAVNLVRIFRGLQL